MQLTEKQKQAANHKNGPCLVLAVPGAGKTTMLLERIKMLENQIDPSHILSLTFSKTQALDMKNRFESEGDIKSNFMTIHAFCYLIIRNYYKKTHRKLKILESDNEYNKYNLIQQIYYDINGKVMSSEDLKNFFIEIGYMKNSMADISYLKKSQVKNIEKIYKAYEDFKKQKSYIDFDDMQIIALIILNQNYKLLRLVKNKYKYIQLDEGQDTSLLQFKIIEKIVHPENNLMVVADDDQSIYSFRAAEPDYLLNFKSIYPNAKLITMDENHRSQANIVKAANNFIIQNQKRYTKNLFTSKNATSKVYKKYAKDSKDSFSYILKNIDPNKTNAIVFRNNISALNLISFLMEKDIAFTINNPSIDFFDSKILSDMVNIINFSKDFYNVELFSEIYYMVNTYLSKEEIEKLDLKAINYTVFDYLHEYISDEKAYGLLRKEKEFKNLRTMNLDKQISYIYNKMGYRDYIKMFSNKYYEVVINKDLYVESMINFTKDLKDLNEFYKKIEEFERILNKNNESNIILSTIHKSKGLEYDNVFIIDLVKGEFPLIYDYKNRENRLEEERRMFYVAMTRARDNLHLITLKYRNSHKVEPSDFYTYV
ncbi:Putative ATP-dependent DNA helicase yjcD [Anaerococcus octavius]|uniref:DNA 3'-5' helicase n=1 Tax=Anaerococcus octavius TaxID=54007 RepID=A0A380WT14_9FIRM|nr:ATP-dependent helicase [Anaerococcus octavius]MDU5535082.1 ATP-dependent helicase [Anaerococcus sp.]SUU92088.1 Putative ATP-dependent DNA helicase yjcD [Anaerococcus octavius]